MFSPWQYNIDPAAVRLLEQTGWQAPDPERYPTGRALVEQYLAPLAAHPAIAPHMRLNRRVTDVTRVGFDKMKTEGREIAPFQRVERHSSITQVEDRSSERAGRNTCSFFMVFACS